MRRALAALALAAALAAAGPAAAASPADTALARRLLVGPGDLGPGWGIAERGERSAICRSVRQGELAAVAVSPVYVRGEHSVVSLAALTRPTAAAARAVAHARTAAYRACVVRAFAAQGLKLTARALPAPRVGVAAAANRFVLRDLLGPIVLDQVIMAHGRAFVGVNFRELAGAPQRRVLAALARRLGGVR